MPPERPAHPDPHPTQRGILCPYCGTVSASDPKRCDRCGGFFDPLSRQASQNAMGPWFIRDAASPFRPGCSFETLRDLVKRGRVTRDTILRGPSTRQYWNFASRTPGIANLLGLCHNCHVPVKPDDFSCTACGAVFSPETDRQHMGLAPVHLLPGQASPEIIAAASVDQARDRPSAPRRTAPKRTALVPPPPPQPTSSGVIWIVALVLVGLVLLGTIAFAVVWFVIPALSGPPPRGLPEPAPATTPAPVKPAPQPETPSPAPVPTGTAEPTSEPPAPSAEPHPPEAALLASFLDEPFDASSLGHRIESLRSSGKLPDADAWAALTHQRSDLRRLRDLP